MSSRARIGLVVLGIGLAGCQGYHRGFLTGAEREIDRILDEKRYQAVGQWQENARYPEPAPEPETESETSTGPAETETTLPESKAHVFSLRETMKTATMNNRNFKSQFEALQLSALDAALQRRNFGPIISNTLSYVYANSPSTNADGNASASVGVSKIVPTGGTVETSTSGSVNDDYEGGDTTYAHDVRVSFEQPLLRGYGYDVAYEDLTQAERNVLYALRDFELFRQDFTIDVVRRYYSILRQKQVVDNSRRSYEQFKFLRKRSEALFEVGRVSAIDKFRAAQQELNARNSLITEQETLAALLDAFKVFLGLPTATTIDVERVQPEMKPVNIDLKSALGAALHNRLDLKTDADRVDDAERKVRVARNGLLPDLDLEASLAVDGAKTGGGSMSYEGSHSVGVSLTLPLDKVPERNRYKSALITRRRRRRGYEERRDEVRVEVMNTYRRLRRLGNSVRIQRANVDLAERRVKNAHIRFEAGELGNRDVVEAESAKLNAQNALIRAILDYEVARLQLKRDIGILFVDSDGMWKE